MKNFQILEIMEIVFEDQFMSKFKVDVVVPVSDGDPSSMMKLLSLMMLPLLLVTTKLLPLPLVIMTLKLLDLVQMISLNLHQHPLWLVFSDIDFKSV